MLGLRRDNGCFQDLSWRCDLPESVDLEVFVDNLREAGFRVDGPGSPLRVARSREDDVVVVVPRTRRMQIRVNYLVSREARSARAEDIARRLAAAAGFGVEP
jgi:hypothetical protein